MNGKPVLVPMRPGGSVDAAVHAWRSLDGGIDGFTLLRTYLDAAATDPGFPGTTPGLLEAVEAGAREDAEKLRLRLGSATPVITSLVGHGELAAEVGHLTASGRFSMVVIEREEDQSLFQEGAGAVVMASHVPVLVVPHHAKVRALRRILLADDEGEVRPGSLLPLVAIARRTGAEVVVLRVLPPEQMDTVANGSDLHHALLSEVPHTFTEVRSDDIVQAITDQSHGNVQLLVLLHRHRGLLDRLFHHSIARELANDTDVPLMVLEQ